METYSDIDKVVEKTLKRVYHDLNDLSVIALTDTSTTSTPSSLADIVARGEESFINHYLTKIREERMNNRVKIYSDWGKAMIGKEMCMMETRESIQESLKEPLKESKSDPLLTHFSSRSSREHPTHTRVWINISTYNGHLTENYVLDKEFVEWMNKTNPLLTLQGVREPVKWRNIRAYISSCKEYVKKEDIVSSLPHDSPFKSLYDTWREGRER